MREVTLDVPFGAVPALGLDSSLDGFESADVESVTVLPFGGPNCVVAVTYETADGEALEAALDDAAHVSSWERLDRDETTITYRCETRWPDGATLARPDREGALAVRTVTVADDGWTVELLGDESAFRCGNASATVEAAPMTLRRLTEYDGPTDELDVLTARQREVLETAHRLGYFEVPREANAEDVAAELGLDRSTVSEHLRRVERNLLSALMAD